MRETRLLLVSALLVAMSWSTALSAAAQDETVVEKPGATTDTVRESLVVSASRIEQSLIDAPVHVTVLSREDLQTTAATTVDDALRQIPGFSLFRRSSSLVAQPTTQGVSLRGIGPSGVSRTLVLLDGIPLNDPFGGWVYWSRVAKESLDRVEVVRGGGSNVWGSAALGGVIQLFTRADDGFHFGAAAEAGSQQLRQVNLSLSDRFARGGYSLHADLFDTDGYPVLSREQRGAIDIPATSKHDLVGGRFAFDPSDRLALFVRASTFDEERGNGTPLTNNDTQITDFGLGVDWVAGRSSWGVRGFGQDQEFASTFSASADDRSSERPALDQFLVDTSSLGLSLQWIQTGGSSDHSLTSGAELRATDGATNEDFFFSGGRFVNRRKAGGEETLAGLYLQDNWTLGDRFELSLGARVDRWQSNDGQRIEVSLVTGNINRDDRFADREETTLSPKVGLVYQASDTTRVRGSLYRAFRAPTINELYRPFRVGNVITEANPLLDPETLTGGEVGASFEGAKWHLDLTGFWNRLDDPIANVTLAFGPGVRPPCGFVPGGGSCRQRQNLDRTRVLGFEADWSLRLSPAWRVEVGYLYDDAEVVRAPSAELEGKRLAQVPEHQLVSRLELSPTRGALRRFYGSLQGRYVGEQFEDDLNQLELDSFVAFDALVGFQASQRWGLFVAGENLTDETVQTGKSSGGLVSIGAPRLVRVGVRLSFDRQRR